MTIWLNLGCGSDLKMGYVNIDLNPAPRKGYFTMKYDLNQGIPFHDNAIDGVYAEHLIEHLDDPVFFMKELWRVCKTDSKIILKFPNFRLGCIACSKLNNPEHKHDFLPEWFESFDPSNKQRMKVYCLFSNFQKEKFEVKVNAVKVPFRVLSWLPMIHILRTMEYVIRMKPIKT